jgi:flagellar basal-body rod modification protein FlgD
MTAPVAINRTMSATGASGSANASPLGNMAGSLGKDDFIKLLVAQLKHQDPMNPQDGTQMATQLAQFSSVEQLMNINQTLSGQSNTNAGLATALENSTAIGLIGKNVSIANDAFTVGGADPVPGFSTELASAGKLTVSILDAQGHIVRTQDMGTVAAGRQPLDISGLSSGLANGNYTVKVSFTNAAGTASTPATLTTAHVDGVQFGPTGLVLRSGTRTYPLSGVTSVDAAN